MKRMKDDKENPFMDELEERLNAEKEGKTNKQNIIGLDTGCVWGNKLTFVRLEDSKKYFIKKIK